MNTTTTRDTPLTVGAAARLARVTVRTLHHYDEIGLLHPSERSAAGYRRYGASDPERLQLILFYRELGFGLADIGRKTDAYRESARRTGRYSTEDWKRLRAESEAIEAGLASLLASGAPASSEAAMDLAERHRLHIDRWFYPCSHQMQVGLSEMYVAHDRFRTHYDDRHTGLAQYVHDAIAASAARVAG